MNAKPAYLLLNQIVMPMSCFFALFATITAFAGHPCLKKLGINESLMMLFTGILLFLSGTLALIGCSMGVNAAQTNRFKAGRVSDVGGGLVTAYKCSWSLVLAMTTACFTVLISLIGFWKFCGRNKDTPDKMETQPMRNSTYI